MNWLNRIPIWAWFVITIALCYALWNPTNTSLWHFWRFGDAQTSTKILVGLAAFGIVVLYALETWRSLGYLGLTLFTAMILVSIWMLYDWGVLNANNISSARWWGQIPIALLLTIGFQGGRIYRGLTGRVPVSPGAEHAGHGADWQQPNDAHSHH